jgi:hypothetical protein
MVNLRRGILVLLLSCTAIFGCSETKAPPTQPSEEQKKSIEEGMMQSTKKDNKKK